MLALKSDKSLIEKVLLFKKDDDDDDLFEPAFATERLKLFMNVISVVEFKKGWTKKDNKEIIVFRVITIIPNYNG